MSKTDFAFWLGIYAGAVASVTALWSLFRELWLERARLTIATSKAWSVATTSGRYLILKGSALPPRGITPAMTTPIYEVVVRNRGRRDAEIRTIGQVTDGGKVNIFGDLLPHMPFVIPAERTKVFTMEQGLLEEISFKRFYVVDGADRVHPLRERYRQRLARTRTRA